jgi:hypothetical protein
MSEQRKSSLYDRAKLINGKVAISDLFKQLGAELIPVNSSSDTSPDYKCRCFLPSHEGFDNNPSMMIYESTNTWWSFCCDMGRTPVDLVKYIKNLSFSEAVKYLEDLVKNKNISLINIKTSEYNNDALSVIFYMSNTYRKYLNSIKNNNTLYNKEWEEAHAYWRNFDEKFSDPSKITYEQALYLYDKLKNKLITKGYEVE